MLKRKFIFLFLILTCLCVLTACQQKQRIYEIGETYEFNGYSVRIDLEADNERFVIDYTEKDYEYSHHFEFCFTYSTETLHNSDEFEYVDGENNPIVFDEYGYDFTGDKIIYVSYANANEEIKSAISDENFSINLGSKLFRIINN